MKTLRLYVREGCHLCEDMAADLHRLLDNRDILLNVVDVDRAPDKADDYTSRVPVLETAEGECLSEYFLEETRVMNYLQASE